MLNFDPIAYANQHSQRGDGGRRISYLRLKDGDTVTLRFLSAMRESVIVRCKCGNAFYEVTKDRWDGDPASHVCPACHSQLDDSCVIGTRPALLPVHVHKYVTCADGSKKSFVCLSSALNAGIGVVPADSDRRPVYQCPICSDPNNVGDNGRPRKAAMRAYGLAVVRTVRTERAYNNGVPFDRIIGIEDEMTTDEQGTHPNVVMVEMPWNSFWKKLDKFPGYDPSICYFDWRITRTGSGLDTSYDVQALQDPQHAAEFDPSPYEPYMTDLLAYLKAMGDPKRYQNAGFIVPGLDPTQTSQAVPQQSAVAGAPLAAPTPAWSPSAAPAPAPAQPPVSPVNLGGTIPYGQVAQSIATGAPQPVAANVPQPFSGDPVPYTDDDIPF